MSEVLDRARAHLVKSKEFLDEATGALERGAFNVATSNAALAGVNAKDAICLKLTARTGKTDNHNTSVTELRKAGPEGAALAATLDRLLKPKTKAQYQSLAMAAKDAQDAVRHAKKIYDGAADVLAT